MNHEKSTWDVENMATKERGKMINNSESYTKAKTATLSVDNLSLSEQAISAIIVLATKYAALQKEVAFLNSASVCEIAARNPSVMKYITELEKRAETAEAQLATARADALREAANVCQAEVDRLIGDDAEGYGAGLYDQSKGLRDDILALLDHPAPSPEAVARAEQAIQFVRQMAMLALSGEHDDDEENHLLSHDILKFQRDCDITEARSILALLDHPAAAPSPEAVARAALDVLTERRRQIEAEGWVPGHDDLHTSGEIALAAGAYALSSTFYHADPYAAVLSVWPWDRKWLKPTTPRRDLVKAGALILAEIERLDRAAIIDKARQKD
jgi:hypothetical protein